MATRLYLLPAEEVPHGTGTARGPKYFEWAFDPDAPALIPNFTDGTQRWAMRDFGLEPTMLVAANVNNAEHQSLIAQPDVTAIPLNIDNTVGANLATVQDALENLHIPADAVTAATAYRQIVRGVLGIFAVAQRFNGRLGQNGRLFPLGITLGTVLSDLSLNVRSELQAAAQDLGYDYSSLTLQSTLRDVLKVIATQAPSTSMLGVVI